MSNAKEVFENFIKSMCLWEDGISERMDAAECEERDGEEGRIIMSEYEALLAQYCTAQLINDPNRRRVNLHYREPSLYRFVEIEKIEQGPATYRFYCADKRTRNDGERFCYYLKLMEGRWLVDKREYIPADGTRPFEMAV